MASEKVSIGLIGAGRTGAPFLKALEALPFVKVVGVADLNKNAEGMVLAREKGIPVTIDPVELALRNDIDILVEVTGDPDLKQFIKETFEKNGNTRTIIMHDLITRLFISVCTGQQELVPSLHPHDVGIGS